MFDYLFLDNYRFWKYTLITNKFLITSYLTIYKIHNYETIFFLKITFINSLIKYTFMDVTIIGLLESTKNI